MGLVLQSNSLCHVVEGKACVLATYYMMLACNAGQVFAAKLFRVEVAGVEFTKITLLKKEYIAMKPPPLIWLGA